jgi:hypothetical protein
LPDNIENYGKSLSDEIASLLAGVRKLKGIRKKMDTRCPFCLSKEDSNHILISCPETAKQGM